MSFFSFHFGMMTKIIPVPWFSGIHMWALNLMKTQGFGWLNQTQTTMVIHTLPLFILIRSIELFISCQHIKTAHLLSILLQCIHCLIHLSSFISAILWIINRLKFFPNILWSTYVHGQSTTIVNVAGCSCMYCWQHVHIHSTLWMFNIYINKGLSS